MVKQNKKLKYGIISNFQQNRNSFKGLLFQSNINLIEKRLNLK